MRNSFNDARLSLCAAAILLLAACQTETLFRSNFGPTPIGQPPSVAQAVGTAIVSGPPGSVIVIAAPAPAAPSGKWLQVSRPNDPAVIVGMQGKFSHVSGDGFYTCSTTMFMPTGAGVATLRFDSSAGQPFLHLDFLPENTVRIDDNDGVKFGAFQRDQPFLVQVTLKIAPPHSTAHVVLAGAAASGTKDYTILTPFQFDSHNFGAITILQGFAHTGAFDVTNIEVTRRID